MDRATRAEPAPVAVSRDFLIRVFITSGLDLIRVVEVPVAEGPPNVLQREHDATVALDLLQMFAFVTDKRVEAFIPW